MDNDKFIGAEKLKEYLKKRNIKSVGTRNLAEANRRFEVLFEWQLEQDRFYLKDRN